MAKCRRALMALLIGMAMVYQAQFTEPTMRQVLLGVACYLLGRAIHELLESMPEDDGMPPLRIA